jgi:FPC/CPF motif-containing protein YcgG
MIPCDVFIKNTDKTIRMGDDCQESLLNLVEAIDDGINKNDSEAIDAFCELYNFLKYTPEDNFNEQTYEERFKPFVDKFVNKVEESVEEEVTGTIENVKEEE